MPGLQDDVLIHAMLAQACVEQLSAAACRPNPPGAHRLPITSCHSRKRSQISESLAIRLSACQGPPPSNDSWAAAPSAAPPRPRRGLPAEKGATSQPREMWDLGDSPPAAAATFDSAPPAMGKQAPQGAFASLDARSPYSSWRYASARESSDSEGAPRRHSPGSGVTAEVSWRAAGAALAARAAARQPQEQQQPVVDTSRTAATEPAYSSLNQQLSPSKRPAVAGGGGAVVLHSAVPPGMDAASYAAGERAALMAAFQQALPSQQALGQLFTGGPAA